MVSRSPEVQTAIPKGVRVLLPEETAKRRYIMAKTLSVFRRWGFQEVVTPTFEYLDVLSVGAGEDQQEKIFKFVDRQTGQLLALRSDLTPQVARMVATSLRHRPLPLRLAYAATVFRYQEPQAGRQREFFQIGVELIGLEQPEADAEMIAMAVESLKELGLGYFQIDVGQVEFFRGLMDAVELGPEVRRKVISAVRRKDASELELLFQAVPGDDRLKECLIALPGLYGGKEVLAKAEGMAFNQRAREALANLRQVYEILAFYGLSDYLIIDLGETYGFEYHSGVVFEAFTKALGYPLSGGGRYDDLIGRFGYPCPATGFAFDLERLLWALEAERALPAYKGADFLIIDFNPDKRQALRLARLLREKGYSVARDIIKRDLPGSLAYARDASIGRAIVLGTAGCKKDELILKDLLSDREEIHSIEGFSQKVSSGELRWPT